MRVSTLSLFIRSLLEPLAQTGAPAESAAHLRRACDLLGSFGEMEVGEFAEVLDRAKEYHTSRQHAFPVHLHPVIACYDRLRSLRQRAAMPEVDREGIIRDLQAISLDSLDVKDLTHLAAEQGWEVKPKAKKAEVIDLIWRSLTGNAKPKKPAASARRATKAVRQVSLGDYAQKINEMKERANSFEVTREELEKDLDSLKLNSLTKPELLALAKQLSRDVNASTKKDAAIQAIKRIVLDVKEMLVAGAG